MTNPKKRSASFHLEPLQLARLSRLSSITKVPQAAIVREGVDSALEKWEGRIVARGEELPPLDTFNPDREVATAAADGGAGDDSAAP